MSDIRQSWVRFGLALALLLATGMFLASRSGSENLPPREALSNLPLELDGWVGREQPIDPDALRVLGNGEFLFRDYVPAPQGIWVNLFIAYFATQRTGSTMHSPKNCLPGSGWTPVESGYMELQTSAGPATVNRYVIARGSERQVVLYWYQSHGRYIASEYSAKIHLVLDSIRMNRSDAALVRLVTPIVSGEDSKAAEQRLLAFAQMIAPQMDRVIPR